MSIIWWTAGVSGIDAPAIRAIRGLQMPQAMTTTSVSMSPRVGADARRPARPPTSMPVTSTPAATVSAPRSCAFWRMSVPGLERVDDADAGRVEAAEDDGLVDERDHRLDLGRGQQAGALDAPRGRRRHPPLQLLHPLGRPGDLDAAALVVDAELAVLVGALDRERRHLLGVVGQEDEVRGVAGRAARVRERALLDEHDVPPAVLGQVVGHAVADDPGADDDDPCPLR